MIVIRKEQIEVFRRAALEAFEDEMVAHSMDFAPQLSRTVGVEQLRLAVRSAIARANSYAFTNRGAIRLFIELMFLYGSAFDSDPQYPWASDILRAHSPQMLRAERLYERVLDYQEKVSGQDGVNTRAALLNLSVFARLPLPIAAERFGLDMLRELRQVFPEKAAYLDEDALRALIREGYAVARERRFPAIRGHCLMVALMFAFGHGCIADPLYPWIERTLNDDRIADPGARAERLEKKSMTWLEHVLAPPAA